MLYGCDWSEEYFFKSRTNGLKTISHICDVADKSDTRQGINLRINEDIILRAFNSIQLKKNAHILLKIST